MAFNEIRINKTRNDKEIERIVDNLIQSSEFCPVLLAKPVFEGFRQLKLAAFDDYNQTMMEREAPLEMIWPEEEKEARALQLAYGAMEHFQTHYLGKMRVAMIELMQESMAFAHPTLLKRCGADTKLIEEPHMDDIQQNVLAHSIRRLKSLPFKKRQGVDGEENNPALSPLARATAEIYNNLAFWTYDHVRVAHFLRDALLPLVKEHENPDEEAEFYANEAAEFIWDNIDGALQEMVAIIVYLSLKLAKASATQRFPESVTKEEAEKFRFRPSDLLDDFKPFLYLWLNNLSVELNRHGGSEPAAEVTDKDCLEYAQKYDDLLTTIQEAHACYREMLKDKDKLDYGAVSADEVVRERFSKYLHEDALAQIGFKYPSEIALFEASKGTKLQGYKKRSLEKFLTSGRKLLSAVR